MLLCRGPITRSCTCLVTRVLTTALSIRGRYFMIFGGGALLAFGLPARPDTSYMRAAREEAAKRLKEEGVI